MSGWHKAMTMLDRLESAKTLTPPDCERLVSDVLRACGHVVTDQGFVGTEAGADCFVEAQIDGNRQRIAFEVKWSNKQADVEAVHQALRMRELGKFDRTMVIARAGFSQQAQALANTSALGQVDLLSPGDLRNWLLKHRPSEATEPKQSLIIRAAMREIARLIAEHPEELATLEWRDLERVLRESFETLGFSVWLTRPGKDGGFDLELTTIVDGTKAVYLVEVKHWSDQKPGSSHLKKLIEVTTSRKASGSLLLSTSGFTRTIYSGIVEFSAPVHLAGSEKVISLCRAFHRIGTGYWQEAKDLQAELFSGTKRLGEAF